LGGRGHIRTIKPAGDPAVLTVDGDVSEPATTDRIISGALESFGRIDTLINNAGVFITKPFTDYTADDYANVVGVNLTGFFWLTQRAIAEMLKRGGGHIVNITTTLADYADSNTPSVLTSLTKGGLASATRSLAIEYASRGVRVNAVSPGIIQTSVHPAQSYATLGARLARSGMWVRSSTPSSSSSHRRSSPARSCTSTAAKSPATDQAPAEWPVRGRADERAFRSAHMGSAVQCSRGPQRSPVMTYSVQ
jgi:NAD(P)-dependent dehydrogenase (short-subunit alcohol dehydrogenase family)